MMKRKSIYILFLSLVLALSAQAQVPAGYSQFLTRNKVLAAIHDSTLHVPAGTTPSLRSKGWNGAGAVFVDSVNKRFYFYAGGTWYWVSDTANKWVNNIQKNGGGDSIIFYIGTTRYAIPDRAGGGGSGGGIGAVYNGYGLGKTNDSTLYVDTAALSSKWIGSLFKKSGTDSIFQNKGGAMTFLFRVDSVSGGGGSPNTSVGSGFKVAINGTNNIKSITASQHIGLDSLTSNQLNIFADTTKLATKLALAKARDSVQVNVNTKANSSLTFSAGVGIDATGLGALTANRTINVDTSKMETKLAMKKTIDSLAALITSTVTVSSATSLTLAGSNTYVFSGSSNTTWTLPAIGTTGRTYRIKNRGSAYITLQRAGSDQLYDAAAIATIVILPGDALEVQDDGTYWIIM